MKTTVSENRKQVLVENYMSSETPSFGVYIEMEAKNDPNFYTWLFDLEDENEPLNDEQKAAFGGLLDWADKKEAEIFKECITDLSKGVRIINNGGESVLMEQDDSHSDYRQEMANRIINYRYDILEGDDIPECLLGEFVDEPKCVIVSMRGWLINETADHDIIAALWW